MCHSGTVQIPFGSGPRPSIWSSTIAFDLHDGQDGSSLFEPRWMSVHEHASATERHHVQVA